MNARRLLPSLLAMAVTACSGAPSQPPDAGRSAPVELLPGGQGTATSAPTPALTPALTPVLPPSSAAPADPSAVPTEPEAALLHGARLDLQGGCAPLRRGLPDGAAGAVTCVPSSDVAALVTIIAFDTRASLRAAYEARVTREVIEMRTHRGQCLPVGASEGAYLPGDDLMTIDERGACWTDGSSIPHYLASRPPFVLLEVEGRAGGTMDGVEGFAWLGNRDQPGGPTLWSEEPMSAEK